VTTLFFFLFLLVEKDSKNIMRKKVVQSCTNIISLNLKYFTTCFLRSQNISSKLMISFKHDLYMSEFFQIYLIKLSIIGRVLYIFDVTLVKSVFVSA